MNNIRTIRPPKSGEAYYEIKQGQLPGVKIRLFSRMTKGYVVDEYQSSLFPKKDFVEIRSKKADRDDGYSVALMKRPKSKPTAPKKTTTKTAAKNPARKRYTATAAKRPSARTFRKR